MQFPHALSGLKKIYKAAILSIIAELVAAFAALISLLTIGADGPGGAITGVFGAGVLIIVSAVLILIAFVMNLVGINAAKPDDENFKKAFLAVIIGIIASVALGFAPQESLVKELSSTAGSVCGFLAIYFICTAIIGVAQSLGNSEMSDNAVGVRRIVAVIRIIGIAAGVIGVVIKLVGISVPSLGAAVLFSIAASVLNIVGDIIYLKLLSGAVRMLEARTSL